MSDKYAEPAASGRPASGAADRDRRRRRAALLADLAEARELRQRIAPRRTRLAKTREALRHRLSRYDPPRRPD
jgi:hypothetical protein